MFLTKIHGSAQVNLFKQLYRDYEEYSDIAFISSPTIRRIIEVRVFSNFNLRINFLYVTKLPGDEFDVYSFAEIESNEYCLPDLQTFAKAIKAVERLLYSPLTVSVCLDTKMYSLKSSESCFHFAQHVY